MGAVSPLPTTKVGKVLICERGKEEKFKGKGIFFSCVQGCCIGWTGDDEEEGEGGIGGLKRGWEFFLKKKCQICFEDWNVVLIFVAVEKIARNGKMRGESVLLHVAIIKL